MNHYPDLIQKFSSRFPLVDGKLICALIEQESRGIPHAVRFEPKFQYFKTPELYAKINSITLDTEIVCQKMSWGLGQIMGSTARDLGLQTVLSELLYPDVNIEYMFLLIQSYIKEIPNLSLEDICAMYNGGKGALHKVHGLYTNQSYVNSVKLILDKIDSVIK